MSRRSVGSKRDWHFRTRLTLWSALSLGFLATSAVAQDPAAVLEDSLIKVVESAEPSVVSIARFKAMSVEHRLMNDHRAFKRFPRDADRTPNELDMLPNEFGAGAIISPANSSDRFVLTNLHVVRGGPIFPRFETDDRQELRIQFSDRRGCRGAIIAADPRSDLAVLRLEWEQAGIKQTDFPRLNWEEATPPRKGQFVILLGNPYAIARDGSASVSWGLVSNLTRQPISPSRQLLGDQEEMVQRTMLYRLGAVMQLDARMNLGTSGGPVLNLKGEMIGISTSLAAIEGYDQSVGFALPIDALTRRIIRTLLAGQEVEYGLIGIQPREMRPKDFIALNTGLPQRSAALVDDVTRGSPADVAKLSSGDVIVSVQGETVRSDTDLMRLVGLHPPDSKIDITVWRKREQSLDTVTVKLGKWPVRDDEGIIETNPRYAVWRGLTVDYSTARERFREESSEPRRVLITKVLEDSAAHTARLQPGNFITHVNNIPVQNPAEFYAAIKGLTGAVSLRLLDPAGSQFAPTRATRVVVIRDMP